MTEVFVGVGSNIQPQLHVARALSVLRARLGPLRLSPVYQCRSVGFDGADFINLVVSFETHAAAQTLQGQLREIEVFCGRDRDHKWAPRTIDLDLLLYGDAVLNTKTLSLPRTDILEYAFVLRPLAEMAPQRRHPVENRSYAELWAAFDGSDQPLARVHLDAWAASRSGKAGEQRCVAS